MKASSTKYRSFFLRYCLLMLALVFLLGFEPIKHILDLNGLYTRTLVSIIDLLFKPLGLIKEAKGSLIYLPNLRLDVQFGCNGLEAVLIYTAGILAFPVGNRQKIIGFIIGFFLLQILNIFRLLLLILAAIYFPSIFQIMHLYIGQSIMIAAALGLFFFWIYYVCQKAQS